MRSHCFMLFAFITLGSTTPATAGTVQTMTRAEFIGGLQTRFSAIDTNRDGFLTVNEIQAAQQKELARSRAAELLKAEGKFNRLDANHDGQVSKTEFLATAPPLQPRQTVQQIMDAFDSNKDGKISTQEYETRALANFNNSPNRHKVAQAQFVANLHAQLSVMDSNHDGYLEPNEIAGEQQKALVRERADELQRFDAEFNRVDANHDGQISKSEFIVLAPPANVTETTQQMISAVDSNKDGKISLQEYEARPVSNFDRLDANHDGVVTSQEIAAAGSQRKQ